MSQHQELFAMLVKWLLNEWVENFLHRRAVFQGHDVIVRWEDNHVSWREYQLIESSIAIGLANDISIVSLFIITLSRSLNYNQKVSQKNILKIVLEAVLNLRGLKCLRKGNIAQRTFSLTSKSRYLSHTQIPGLSKGSVETVHSLIY